MADTLETELARYRSIPGLADVLEGKAVVVPVSTLTAFQKLVSLEFDEGTDGQPLVGALDTAAWEALEAEMRTAAFPYAKEKSDG